jgi:membrane fusion protein (multidrug efflux system)
MEAVSKQDYTDALAQARQADARSRRTCRAAAAQVNLRFTRVPAPISGRIGLSSFTEGALVTANQPNR